DVDSPDLFLNPLEVDLRATGGGSEECAIEFSPVAAASFFCPVESRAFGSVNYGQARTIDLRIRNIGSKICYVTDIHPQVGTSSTFSFPTTNLTILVNSAGVIPVTFEPEPPSGDPFDELDIICGFNGIEMTVNNGPNGGNQTESVAFSGTGKRPSIDVIPGEIDFGDVTVGCCSAAQRVAIYNSGTTTLTIDSTSILGGNGSDFEIVQPPGDTTLSGGEFTEMTIRFCASSVGPASDVAEIRGHDNNSNQEYFAVSLSGNGVLTSDGEDIFVQPLRPLVDVLWVIDDSGSMGDEQDSLANNFDSFITQAVTLDTDYHIGVTNTDGETEWSGRLYACNGNPRYITSSQPQAQQESQFACNVKTSDPDDNRPSSDSKESALQAGRNAFEYPNMDNWNAGFYREDAKLYVILVTDEVDQSDGPANLYVDFFRNLKGIGNPDLLNISAITGPPPDGCPTAEGNQKGYDAVTAVGGQFRSICNPDWSDLVTTLGLDVFNARRQFPLSRAATASSIEVRVCANGCPADPTTCPLVGQDAANGWTFDAAVNAVTFNGASIPGRGACVSVTYLAICYPP
ncbi:MAG: choice-of-anchor D domain-containing protein, partial [Deltaproteobacteria bacterium]|nr:choice-of-anchor D domain-containing protein [Deltaproteobacteria bacterium]